MPKQEKVTEVAALKEKISRATSLYFVDFTAVEANDLNMVRRRLRETGATVRVAKNRLAKRAMQECGIAEGAAGFLRGPTSIVLGADDPVAPARVLRELIRKVVALKVKGAYLDATVYPAEGFAAIAALPTKADLQGQLVGALAAPIWEFTLGLERLLSDLVFVIDELSQRPAGAAAEGS